MRAGMLTVRSLSVGRKTKRLQPHSRPGGVQSSELVPRPCAAGLDLQTGGAAVDANLAHGLCLADRNKYF